jgi:hypothetical protein
VDYWPVVVWKVMISEGLPSPRRSTLMGRLAGGAAYLFAVANLFGLVYLTIRWHVVAPLNDYWPFLDQWVLANAADGISWSELWRPVNQHRIPFTRWLLMMDLLYFQGLGWLPVLVSFFAMFAAVGCWTKVITQSMDQRWAARALLFGFAFPTAGVYAYQSAFPTHIPTAAAAALASLLCAARWISDDSSTSKNRLGMWIFAAISSLCFSAGLCLWPILLIWLTLRAHDSPTPRLRQTAVWTLVWFALLLAVFLFKNPGLSDTHESNATIGEFLGQLAILNTGFLWFFGERNMLLAAFALFGAVIWAVLLQKNRTIYKTIEWQMSVALLMLSLLSGLLIVFARGWQGSQFLTAGHYVTFVALGWLAAASLCLLQDNRLQEDDRVSGFFAVTKRAAISGLALLFALPTTPWLWRTSAAADTYNLAKQTELALISQVEDPAVLEKTLWNIHQYRAAREFLQRAKKGIFSSGTAPQLGQKVSTETRCPSKATSQVVKIAETRFRLSGTLDGAVVGDLLITDEQGVLLGFAGRMAESAAWFGYATSHSTRAFLLVKNENEACVLAAIRL